jgi:hypothetical protein
MEKTYRSISQTKIWVDADNEAFVRPYLEQISSKPDESKEEDW